MKKIIAKLFPVLLIAIFFSGISYSQKGFNLQEKEKIKKFKIAQKYFLKGKKEFYKKDFENSEKNLKKCLKEMPEHADAFFYLSKINYYTNNIKKASKNIEKAKENYINLSKFWVFQHQQLFDMLREQQSEQQDVLTELQSQLSSQNLDSSQRKEIERKIGVTQNNLNVIRTQLNEPVPPVDEIPADYFYFHGNIYFKMKEFDKAAEQYKKAIEKNPKQDRAYNNLINIYYMNKKCEKALHYIKLAEKNEAKIHPKLKQVVEKMCKK